MDVSPPLEAIIEVEVAEDDGAVVWKPAKVQELTSDGRFVVCVNGEPDFLEEYGLEDEGIEWRLPSAEALPVVTAAYDAAALQAASHVDAYRVEAIIAKRQLPAAFGRKEEYLVKWKNYSEGAFISCGARAALTAKILLQR